MYKITAPDLLERLRHIAHSRGYFVKKDSLMGGYKVTSDSGEISSGHVDRLTAFQDICEIENVFAGKRGFSAKAIDIDFLINNEAASSLQIDETIQIAGEKYIVDDIATKSGCIESASTSVSLSDGYGVSHTMTAAEIVTATSPAIQSAPRAEEAPRQSKSSQPQYSFWN